MRLFSLACRLMQECVGQEANMILKVKGNFSVLVTSENNKNNKQYLSSLLHNVEGQFFLFIPLLFVLSEVNIIYNSTETHGLTERSGNKELWPGQKISIILQSEQEVTESQLLCSI